MKNAKDPEYPKSFWKRTNLETFSNELISRSQSYQTIVISVALAEDKHRQIPEQSNFDKCAQEIQWGK